MKGLSAYELAFLDGFTGTEEEWLDSLKDDVGLQGQDGKSAYDMAVETGFQGTEEEWPDSLKPITSISWGDIKGDIANQSQFSIMKKPNSIPVSHIDGSFDLSWDLIQRPLGDGKLHAMLDGDWVEIDNKSIDLMRIPVKITAATREGVLPNQPISIQATGSGIQTTLLDGNGEFNNYLRPETEYTVKLLHKSQSDLVFPTSQKILTGGLELPLDVNISAVLGMKYVNQAVLDDIKNVVMLNKSMNESKEAITFGTSSSGANKYAGGVLAPNGKIYGIPMNTTTILEITLGNGLMPFDMLSTLSTFTNKL